MDRNWRALALIVVIGAGALVITPGSVVAANKQASATVTVFSDHYVALGHAVETLDQVEVSVTQLQPARIRVQVCGPDAGRPFLAVVHRFREFMLDPVVLAANDRDCRIGEWRMRPVAVRAGHPSDTDEITARYWRELMP